MSGRNPPQETGGDPAGFNAFSGYWFRVPTELHALLDLKHSDLKVYLVVLRAIQRDTNRGKLSVRVIARRAKLSIQHTCKALDRLCGSGLLTVQTEGKGKTTVYNCPIKWQKKDAKCAPTGEQLEDGECTPTGEHFDDETDPSEGEHHYAPTGEHPETKGTHQCSPTGVQKCAPTGEQHSELSEERKSHHHQEEKKERPEFGSFRGSEVRSERPEKPKPFFCSSDDDDRKTSLRNNSEPEWEMVEDPKTGMYFKRAKVLPPPIEYASPTDELKAIALKLTGEPIPQKDLSEILDSLEIRMRSMSEFIGEVKRQNLPGIRNPIGFLKSFAKKSWRSAAPPELAPPPAPEKCELCDMAKGKGIRFEGERFIACSCADQDTITAVDKINRDHDDRLERRERLKNCATCEGKGYKGLSPWIPCQDCNPDGRTLSWRAASQTATIQ